MRPLVRSALLSRVLRLPVATVSIALVTTVAGCASQLPPNVPAPVRQATPSTATGLRAELRGPKGATYDPKAMGPGGRTVSVRLTAEGAAPVTFGSVRFAYRATREGVSFPCREHEGGSFSAREPSSLAPGQSFVFERDLDCALPLVGTYDVEVDVLLGRRPEGGPLSVLRAGSFSFALTRGDRGAPTAVPAVPGLFALAAGTTMSRPMSHERWMRSDHHVLVALVNGGRAPLELPRVRVSFQVFKVGSPVPCGGEAVPAEVPPTLAPGATFVLRAPISCAPSQEGTYEIVGRLLLGESEEPLEVGRVPLRVSSDALLFSPALGSGWGIPAGDAR
ncbi:MAG: hypothetical protein U0169_04605 [Polyangiaceae bacterium]